MNETIDFGPITSLIEDPTVIEIMITAPDAIHIWHIDRGREPWDQHFTSEDELYSLAQQIAASIGETLNANQPFLNHLLRDGSRVQIVIPPVSVRGTVLFIRKPAGEQKLTMEKLIEYNAISGEAAEFLRACVRVRANMLVFGRFNSGVRTMLNILVDQIPQQARIAVIQSSMTPPAIDHPYAVILETRLPDIDGKGAITGAHLLNVALRMQPDRLVLTDIDGAEIPSLLNAMSVDFSAQFAMLAESPRDALVQLERRAAATNPTTPVLAVREHIARTLNILVQMEFMADGFKRVGAISEVQGLHSDSIIVKPIFQFEKNGTDEHGRFLGGLVPTGVVPDITERFDSYNIDMDADLFNAQSVD